MISLTRKQTIAFKAATSGEYRVVIFGGAIRGGKTYALLTTFCFLALNYPKSRWVIVRRSLPDLKRNTFPSFDGLLDIGVRDKVRNWNHDTQVVTFLNGSEIMFMAESFDTDKDLNRFKGLEANGFGFEEVNECQKETFFKAIERTGTWLKAKGNPPMVIFCTLNPAHNWTKETFYEPFRNNTMQKDWTFIPSLITDNPHIPASYHEGLKSMNPVAYARFVLGDWDIVESIDNPWMYAFRDEHIFDDSLTTFNRHQPYVVSLDFNIDPYCGTVWQVRGKDLYCFDEFAIDNGSTPKLCDYLIHNMPDYKHFMRITGDAMGNRRDINQRDHATTYQQIKRALNLRDSDFKIKANPTHENSRAQCNKMFYDGRVHIHSSCKRTIADLKTVASGGGGEIIKSNRNKLEQRADHFDTVRYICSNYG